MQFPIGLTFNAHPERTVSVENVINMQPEATPRGRSQYVLRSCPGLREFVGVGGSRRVRGMIEVRGLLYVVAGPVLYRINADLTVDEFTYIDGSGPVGISTNGTEIHLAAGEAGFIFNVLTEEVIPITDEAYPTAYTSAFVAGRFVVEDAESQGKFCWSEQYDGTNWNGLDFATAELLPDPVIAVYGRGQTATVFGSQTTEFWRPSEAGFSPIPGSGQRMGLRSRASVAETAVRIWALRSALSRSSWANWALSASISASRVSIWPLAVPSRPVRSAICATYSSRVIFFSS